MQFKEYEVEKSNICLYSQFREKPDGGGVQSHHPKVMTSERVDSAGKVITMGCGVNLDDVDHGGAVCPAVFVESEDWGLEDPKGKPVENVREIRDLIKARVEKLIEEMTASES